MNDSVCRIHVGSMNASLYVWLMSESVYMYVYICMYVCMYVRLLIEVIDSSSSAVHREPGGQEYFIEADFAGI